MAEELNVPDQPDGIDMDSFDLPKPQDAASRVDLFLEWYGDGRVETLPDGPRPLYARDMQALTYAVRDLLWLHAEAAWKRANSVHVGGLLARRLVRYREEIWRLRREVEFEAHGVNYPQPFAGQTPPCACSIDFAALDPTRWVRPQCAVHPEAGGE